MSHLFCIIYRSIYITVCPNGHCQNGGTCVLAANTGAATCICLPGYSGIYCQTSGKVVCEEIWIMLHRRGQVYW